MLFKAIPKTEHMLLLSVVGGDLYDGAVEVERCLAAPVRVR